jgi:hypothetical protein
MTLVYIYRLTGCKNPGPKKLAREKEGRASVFAAVALRVSCPWIMAFVGEIRVSEPAKCVSRLGFCLRVTLRWRVRLR